MVKSTHLILSFTLLLTLSNYRALQAAAPITRIVMTTGSQTEREAAPYIARDRGLFRRYGVDVELVHVRSGLVGTAALSTGESQLHWGSVTNANLGAIAEGADLVFVAGFINKLTGTLVANPKIAAPTDLKGRILGLNSLSGGGWLFTMLALDHWGLAPERDKIQFRTLGDQPVIAQGLLTGIVDAAYLGYTYGNLVQGKGFRLLADLHDLPIPYQGSGIIARRSFVNSSPAIPENVVRGLLDSVEFIRNPANKSDVLRSLARGMGLARTEEAEEGYRRVAGLYERKIYPSVDGLRHAIRLLGATNDKVRRLKAEDLVINGIARKLEREGRF
jgi:NitT/TauT family transport system substrate-binding protein